MTTDAKHWAREPRLLASPLPSFILSLHSETTGRFSTYSVIMRLTGTRAYPRPTAAPKMPPGMVELMEGLTKNVLRNNPENVYEFCAEHMQKLLEIRDGAPRKKQMTLDEKIKKAQDKIRQRLQNRRLEEKEQSKPPKATRDKSIIVHEPMTEVVAENTDALKTPVKHEEESVIAREVEIFHESDMSETAVDDSFEANIKDHYLEESMSNTGETFLKDESTKATEEVVKETHAHIEEGMAGISATHQTMESQETGNTVEEGSSTSNLLQTEEAAISVKEEVKINENVASDPCQSVEAKNQIRTIDIPISDVVKVTNESHTDISCDENTDSAPKMVLSQDFVSGAKESLQPYNLNLNDNTAMEIKDIVQTDILDNKAVNEDLFETSTEEIALISNNQDNKTVEFKNQHVEKIDDHSQLDETSMEGKIVNQEKTEGICSDVELINHGRIITDREKGHNEIHDDEESTVCTLESANTEENLLNYSKLEETIKNESGDKIVEGCSQQTNSGSNSESEDKRSISENLEHLKHSNINDDFQHGLNDVHLSKIDEDVLDNFDKLVTQEPQSASELVITNKDNILGSTPVMNNKEDTIVDDDDPAENPTAMDLETAAITIQKVFRTFLFSKSRASTLEDTMAENYLKDNLEDIDKKDEPEYVITTANLIKERRTIGISRMDTVLQTVNEEKSLSLSTDDSSTISSAATTIQAHVRGFLVRNKLASSKTASRSSLVNSDAPSTISLDGDTNEPKKTILNIHIVPERGQFMSRDESMLTSIDLPLDNSPPSSINLHPLGYDKSEPRKQLKREDAIQSVSPPSNYSGKLSEDVDSVKEVLNENSDDLKQESSTANIISTDNDQLQDGDAESCDTTLTISSTADTVIDAELYNTREVLSSSGHNSEVRIKEVVSNLSSDKEVLSPEHLSQAGNKDAVTNLSSDEMDVVTPFPISVEKPASPQGKEIDEKPKLLHSGEFHDVVVQTQVKRSESSVVRGE